MLMSSSQIKKCGYQTDSDKAPVVGSVGATLNQPEPSCLWVSLLCLSDSASNHTHSSEYKWQEQKELGNKRGMRK